MITPPTISTIAIPPLGSAESWRSFVPDSKHRWWNEAMTRLVNMSDDELSICDIGEVNLIVAHGLPGAGALDIGRYVARLDQWADQVAKSTERNWKHYQRRPSEFRNSQNFFRVVAMVTVLQRDLGARYDPGSREGDYNATDSRQWFLHGILDGIGGTCVSMPILYVAIGRRLGYPLRLVRTWEHLFVRWDDPDGECFNIEATSLGLNSYPDEYYLTWPKKFTRQQIGKGVLMRSLPPRAELAEMLAMRGSVFRDNYKFGRALEAYYHAERLDPVNPNHPGHRAVVTILHNELSGLASYGLGQAAMASLVTENGSRRKLQPWERWAVPEARKTLQRINSLHHRNDKSNCC